MDRSEKYIEMCRAASEIQEAWLPTLGDFFEPLGDHLHDAVWALSDFGDLEYAGANGEYQKGEHPEIWLPRQDQLQDLLRGSLKDIAEGFYDYMTAGGYDYECPEFYDARCKEYDSMEQLWLAYVMESKYGKQWSGAAWIDPNAEKKSLLSQIIDAHTRFQGEHMKPKIIVMSSETWGYLKADLIHYQPHISTAPSGVESIYGLRVAIDNDLKKGEFRIMGVPL